MILILLSRTRLRSTAASSSDESESIQMGLLVGFVLQLEGGVLLTEALLNWKDRFLLEPELEEDVPGVGFE
jgi:hypothetical protein